MIEDQRQRVERGGVTSALRRSCLSRLLDLRAADAQLLVPTAERRGSRRWNGLTDDRCEGIEFVIEAAPGDAHIRKPRIALRRTRRPSRVMPAVHSESSETVVDILKSASSPAPDSRLTEVLEAFRRQWLAIARKKYPSLGPDIEDTIQIALLKLVSADRLASLRDA